MDWPTDAESPWSAAVPQRTVRKWHCSGLELGKVGQLRLLPIFTFTLCHGCFLSTHSLQPLYWEFICSFLRAFDLPLYSVAELQSAPIWNHPPAHFSFQSTLGQCCSAAASTCPWAEAAATDLTPRYLRVWSCDELDSAVLRNTSPCCSPLACFRFVPSSLSCYPLKAARSCSASQWRGASALLPFWCSS